MKHAFLLFSLVVLLISCSEKRDEGIYDQGRLEYKITYLNAAEDNYDPSFLPKKMVLDFNQDFSINNIDGFMGFFKLGNMTSFRNNRVKTYLKVLDQNYAFVGGRNEMMCCFDCMDGMKMEEDTTTVTIAGLKSKKVHVSFKDSNESFDIYYTHDINLNKPNITNPYKDVDGVLTEFRLVMGPYLMQFRATKFNPDYVPKEQMKIPDRATLVNRLEMVAILNRLMIQNQ
ncbi:MAG: hypothetical protein PVF73_02625 [Bacteroidales bacterium]|jgi:hypothetical protein